MRKTKYRFYWQPMAYQNRSRMFNRTVQIQRLMQGGI